MSGQQLPPLVPLPRLGDTLMTRGADPELLRDELYGLIYGALADSPRSRQTTIGPSEIGTPCPRRLGYMLAGTPKPEQRSRGWIPAIGTACHTMLAEMLATYNTNLGWSRYLLETRVDIGTVGGVTLRGSADVYDRVTCTVIDWKIVGVTTLKAARRHGPSATYRTQIHSYGLGFVNRGVPVDEVVIAYLPRSGELADGYWHVEKFDPTIAETALTRADAIATALALAPAETVIPQLLKGDDCGFCPWKIRSLDGADTDPTTCCPGFTPAKPSLAETLVA